MSRIFRCLLMLCLLFAGAHTAQAGAARTPLLLQLGENGIGDIFTYTEAGFKALSDYGYNGVPVLSSDGKTIVYSSWAQTYVDDNAAGFGRSGPPAANIWLMDVTTKAAKRIAEQPPDTRTDKTSIRPFTARTDPVWSPDGKSIAWFEESETPSADQNDHLMVYSVATGKTTEIYSQPIFCAGGPCSSVLWTSDGLVVIAGNGPTGQVELRILDKNGQLVMGITYDAYPQLVKWVTGGQSPAVLTDTALFNLSDKSRETTLPPLEIFSWSAPDGITFQSDAGYVDATWSVAAPGGQPIVIGKVNDFAIAPDGKSAAYTTDDGASLYITDGSTTTKVNFSGVKIARKVQKLSASGLVWSSLGLRVR